MLFLQANLGNIVAILTSLVVIKFFPQTRSLPIILSVGLIYIDITIFGIVFEYQRIALTLARIAKKNSPSLVFVSIPQIQVILASGLLSTLFFFTSFLTGFVFAYLFLNSVLLVGGYFIFKYLISDFIPNFKPYGLLFKLMSKELTGFDISNMGVYMSKSLLRPYFEEMPHSKEYETWAIKKYGLEILKVN